MMAEAMIIGVHGFGQDHYDVRAIQWAYDSQKEYLVLILLGEDKHIPLKICNLSNVIPKEFVLRVTKNKKAKAMHRDIFELRYEEHNDALIEAAQRFFDSPKNSWTTDEIVKALQRMEM